MWETLYGMLLAYPIVCYVFVPVYFSLGITSVYQYIDMRFKSRLVRCLASGTYVIRQMLNQGVTVFTPCVALNTVIGIPYWASIVGISLISIVFNLLVSGIDIANMPIGSMENSENVFQIIYWNVARNFNNSRKMSRICNFHRKTCLLQLCWKSLKHRNLITFSCLKSHYSTNISVQLLVKL